MVLTRNGMRAQAVVVKSMGDERMRVFRERISVTDVDVDRITTLALDGNPIFNPDKKRMQNDLDTTDPLVVKVVTALRDEMLLEGRVVGDAVALHSLAGCCRQRLHTDYDPARVKHSLVKPFGVLFALEDSTRLLLSDSEVALGRGDLLVFDGDVVHAGADYAVPNTRIHLYVDYDGVPRLPNTTYFVRAEADS